MATETQRIMFVKAKILNKQPKAFQEYVKEFFKKRNIFGSEYYFAFLQLEIYSGNRNKKGVAPCHSANVNYFGEKASEPYKNLYDLIQTLLKGKKSGVYEIVEFFDDGKGWNHVD